MPFPPALLSFLAVLPPLWQQATSHLPATVVAEHFDWYREDDVAARPVARLGLSIVRLADGSEHAYLRIAAEGLGVDPEPGFEGVVDANGVTAHELERAVDEHRLRFELVGAGDRALPDGAVSDVHVAVTRWGAPPRRSLDEDGGFGVVRTGPDLPLELSAWTGALPRGRSALLVSMDGMPRLRVAFERRDGAAPRILSVESLSGRDR